MVSKPKATDIEKALYINYLKRAEECIHAARNSFASQEWNAATINAIHCSIAASDAVCVYFLGKRHIGENHGDVAKLLKTIKPGDEGLNVNANRVTRIIGIKNMAEYEERLVYKSEAERVLKDCERFLEYTKKKLP